MEVKIDGVKIENALEYTFLGVTLDSKLSWKPHLGYTQTKVSKSISVINKVKTFLEHDALRILYCSLVLPHLTYCVEVWGNNYKSSLHPLFILQKRAVRIIHKVSFLEHTNGLFLKFRLLKLLDLVKIHTVIILFKANKNALPCNIQGNAYSKN